MKRIEADAIYDKMGKGFRGIRLSYETHTYKYLKRFLDVLFAAILLVMLSPVIFILSVLIRADSLGPALFLQKRVGKDGEEFWICKLRTMHITAPPCVPSAQLRDRRQHVTHVGKFLRMTGLDELPQLWNILVGEMSFVGPRPVIPAEENLLSCRCALGADHVRPGLTGLAQVRGRDALSDREKAQLDAQYVHSLSFLSDLRIFLLTVPAVILGRGGD